MTLFEEILKKPAKDSDTLYIVAGYATPGLASRHLAELRETGLSVKINLIYGMTPRDGIMASHHAAFKELAGDDYPLLFKCSYYNGSYPVHSKEYAWFKEERPVAGFLGSANYTQLAFGSEQEEAMGSEDPMLIKSTYDRLLLTSIDCLDTERLAPKLIVPDRKFVRLPIAEAEAAEYTEGPIRKEDLVGVESNLLTLLAKNGEVGKHSGLNWGIRDNYKRDRNQAYIPVSGKVQHSDFFPEIAARFTVLTDDGARLDCTRAQTSGKAIHTYKDNSLLGKYFRMRLGLNDGEEVTKVHLEKYGRTDVTFYRLDEYDTYFMDFSV